MEVRKVKGEAIVMESERESGRGELTRVELAVMEETEEEWMEDML